MKYWIEKTREKCESVGLDYDAIEPNIKLSDGNSKLKKSGIVSWNLIAIVHCPYAGECKSFCYATVGQQAFPSGVKRRAAAFKATLDPNFVDNMHNEIARWKRKRNPPKAIRIHDSGDFYNMKYFTQWMEIASKNLDMIFYAYSKSLPFLHRGYKLGIVPPNIRIIQSIGGIADHKIKEEYPHARIFETHEELLDSGYGDANETDDAAAFGENPNVGLVIHGAKKKRFKGTQEQPTNTRKAG